MIRCPLLLLLFAAPATAAERRVYPGSFDHIRVQGPFDVRIATGRAPGATLTGDARTIEGIEVRVDGATLVVRSAIGRWDDRTPATQPVTVTLTTPNLVAASVTGSGRLTIAKMAGPRIDVSVTGSGGIAVSGVATDELVATLIGGGAITLAGRTGKARLMTNGPGTIDAAALDAGDLTVRLDGPGSTTASARYTATIANTGIGSVSIAGKPKCQVKADAGGAVRCGTGS